MRVVGGIQGKSRYYELQEWGAGKILVPGENPDGIEFPKEMLQGIMLDPRTPLLDARRYSAVAQFFIRALVEMPEQAKNKYTVDASNEAAVLLAISEDMTHQLVGVPPQVVGSARVSMERSRRVRDLITGEEYEHWPPPGYYCNGDIHSHNTMANFFSGTDNRDDAAIPGAHLVFGNFKKADGHWTWGISSSVVVNFTRYVHIIEQDYSVRKMTAHDLMVCEFVEDELVHDDAWANVKIHQPKPSSKFFVFDNEKSKGERRPLRLPPTTGAWGVEETLLLEQHERMRREWEERRGKESPFPDDYDWLQDFLRGEDKAKDLPGQTYLFDPEEGIEEIDVEQGEGENRKVEFIKREIENVLDSIDWIVQMAPDEQTGREIVCQMVNSTGLLTKTKARKVQ